MNQFQLKSMTAYGRGVASFPYGRFIVEIQSVNRRHLEMSISLPRLLSRFEIEIRKKIAAFVGRGMVQLAVVWKTDAKQPIAVMPNIPLAKALKGAWDALKNEWGHDEPIPLSILAQEKDVMLYDEELEEEEEYRKGLDTALQSALSALFEMKQAEGLAIAEDLSKRLKNLSEIISQIELHAEGASEKVRQKLTSRMEELFSESVENEERILREIALYAERLDITEEIVRFRSHLKQFEILLEKPVEKATETKGKTLDFLVQELLREVNTISSKASHVHIAGLSVNVKSELEKIREQIQNVE